MDFSRVAELLNSRPCTVSSTVRFSAATVDNTSRPVQVPIVDFCNSDRNVSHDSTCIIFEKQCISGGLRENGNWDEEISGVIRNHEGLLKQYNPPHWINPMSSRQNRCKLWNSSSCQSSLNASPRLSTALAFPRTYNFDSNCSNASLYGSGLFLVR